MAGCLANRFPEQRVRFARTRRPAKQAILRLRVVELLLPRERLVVVGDVKLFAFFRPRRRKFGRENFLNNALARLGRLIFLPTA